MKKPLNKKQKINIVTIEEPKESIRTFGDMGFLPDFFYEDGDVKIPREDVIYLFDDDCDDDVTEFLNQQWSELEKDENFSKVCIERRINTDTPKIYKHFETALFTFAFSHMINEIGRYNFAKTIKKVAGKHGVRRFIKPTTETNVVYKNPHQDMPYQDWDVDQNANISLFMIYDEKDASYNSYYDSEHEKTGNPAITFYVSNYVKEIREADKKDEAVLIIDQILTRMQADLKHELMHYVQDVFLSNKSDKQVQSGSNEDEVEYYTSQKEFDPTIRSEIGEFLATRRQNPSLQKHIDQSKFFNILKKHSPKKHKLAIKKFVIGVQQALGNKRKQ